jgi:E3 ubiquitin-protein ligase MUL1
VIVTNRAEKHGSCRVLAAAKRSGQDNEGKLLIMSIFEGKIVCMRYLFFWIFFSGSNDKAENGSDGAKRERPIPDLCVICLEQEYNAVFLP